MNILKTHQDPHDILSCLELNSSLDKHFGLFIGRLAKKYSRTAALTAALVSRKTSEGNICLDLKELAGKPLQLNSLQTKMESFVCLPLDDWTEQLMESGVVCQDEGDTPLVLDRSGRIYLKRYWDYENSIFRFIQERAAAPLQDLDFPRLAKDSKELFKAQSSGEIDWQQVAAVAAATRSFCIISGGPGTGKTTTVAKILAFLNNQHHNNSRRPRILLGAPTGKAASRLQQTIADIGLLNRGSEPLHATTLHRMLGHIADSPYFLHNAENPLAADIVIVDEASMVDLPLLAKLMQAIPVTARLILLGDRHQLASVQPGSVLGDICRSGKMADFSKEFNQLFYELTGYSIVPEPLSKTKTTSSSLQDSFVELVKSYRFTPESGIAKLSMAVKQGDGNGALDILLRADDGSIAWSEIPAPADLEKKLLGFPGFSQFTSMQQYIEPDSCFKQLDNFRILCALRNGPFGTKWINALLEQQITQQAQDVLSKHNAGRPDLRNTTLAVRPVMVTQNNYNLKLFNGDVGIILPHPENPQSVRVFFRGESGMLRDITPTLLPEHETVFAMTVHKSQGSEFNSVLIILPDQDSPLLTRELLYTAITRAKKNVEIWGSKAIFSSAVKRQINRTSGLAEALWGEDM